MRIFLRVRHSSSRKQLSRRAEDPAEWEAVVGWGWALLTRGCLTLSSISAVWFSASSAPQATASLDRVKFFRVFAQGP